MLTKSILRASASIRPRRIVSVLPLTSSTPASRSVYTVFRRVGSFWDTAEAARGSCRAGVGSSCRRMSAPASGSALRSDTADEASSAEKNSAVILFLMNFPLRFNGSSSFRFSSYQYSRFFRKIDEQTVKYKNPVREFPDRIFSLSKWLSDIPAAYARLLWNAFYGRD